MMRPAFYPILRAFTSLAVGIFALCVAPQVRAEEPAGEVVGFQDASGKTLFLHDFKGKPVLINLWATWCAPCIQEMPSLAKLQQDYASQGLVVLALSEDETLNLATDYYKKAGITNLTPYFDKEHAVYVALNTQGLPTSAIISAHGQILQRIEGPVDWQSPKVHALIDAVIKLK